MKTSSFSRQLKQTEKNRRRAFVDLHMHSRHSDGELPVHDLIDRCVDKGMKAMAITDHDTIEAYEEGREYAESLDMEFVPGVEVSSAWEGSEVHILGYFFDPTHLTLNQTLLELQQKREVRARNIVGKLNRHGVEVRLERVLEKAGGSSIGRPHIAAVMVEEEYVSHMGEAFEKYLSQDFIREFETEKMKPTEAVQLIAGAGGVSVMAHPARTQRDDIIEMLVEAGLKGIETYCNGMNKATIDKYIQIAKRYDLICCGGADFHSDKAGARFGLGSVKVPYSSLESLKERVANS